MARENKNIVVGLDIGTSKVACLVADITPDGRLEVLGMGSHESKGLKKGVVVNIEATVAAIRRALEEAELMADCKIATAFVGIAGNHIRSFNSTGMVAVKDREVSALDVERAIDTARAVNIPTDQQILHVLRQEFIIDGQEDVREPIGMSGVRLEVKVHIVTGAVSAAQNIVKCVRPHPAATCFGTRGAVRRREGPRRVPARYRRWHHRHRHLHAWRDSPYGGDSGGG
jgi:cell division protein FtsA